MVKVNRFPSCCVKNPPPFSSTNAFLVSALLLCTLVLHVCFVFTKAHCARHSLLKVFVLVKQSRPTEQTDYTESRSMWTHQTCTALRSVCLGISLRKTCCNINVNFFFFHKHYIIKTISQGGAASQLNSKVSTERTI